MMSRYFFSLLIVAGWMTHPIQAADFESVLEDQASALFAAQLSSEIAGKLRQEFIKQGKTPDEADALAFRAIDDAAHCSVRKLNGNDMPAIQSYVELLVRNEEMSSVLNALRKTYSKPELDEMQFEIDRAVQGCLCSSKPDLTG